MKNKVYIIGLGKAGSSFSFELDQKEYQVSYLTDRKEENIKKISSLLNPVSYSLKTEKEFVDNSDIIMICVQDRYIGQIVSEIISFGSDLKDKYFIHISGSETSDIFNAGSINPENTVSMHPIQTFNSISYTDNHLLEKIYFGIEGGSRGKNLAERIILSLNSRFIEIPKDKKYLYHSACVISSNFLITLLNVSSEIMGSIGIERGKTFEIFRPIIEKTLGNISENGLTESLTGPFERNDIETISNHLSSISRELPSLIPFYTLLGMETVRVAFRKESLNMKNVISILDLMNEYISDESALSRNKIN
jgi:predicted short-subunit dehydrogenase-like oxidoreductase (DUF2520 family)